MRTNGLVATAHTTIAIAGGLINGGSIKHLHAFRYGRLCIAAATVGAMMTAEGDVSVLGVSIS
jgi:hypothetical protein